MPVEINGKDYLDDCRKCKNNIQKNIIRRRNGAKILVDRNQFRGNDS